jgi:hypothetical protein
MKVRIDCFRSLAMTFSRFNYGPLDAADAGVM